MELLPRRAPPVTPSSIDPESYFRHVMTVLPAATTSQIKDLTPSAIARSGLLPRIGKPSRHWNAPQLRAA